MKDDRQEVKEVFITFTSEKGGKRFNAYSPDNKYSLSKYIRDFETPEGSLNSFIAELEIKPKKIYVEGKLISL
jgi:hypothetical protein